MIDFNKKCPIYFKRVFNLDEPEYKTIAAYYKINKIVNDKCYGTQVHINKLSDGIWYDICSMIAIDTKHFNSNKDWYKYDDKNKKYILTSKAPQKAKESYNEFYKIINK